MSDDEGIEFIRIDQPKVQSEMRATKFLPWHKPRKQWIREHQWGNGLRNFLNRHVDLGERPLAYLTFPGEDYLDVRYLNRIAVQDDFQISFQGFDSTQSVAAGLSLSEVKDLPNVCSESDVIRDKFEAIANSRSLARESVRRKSGFDLVNLDFCNSVASMEAGTRESSFDAIASLVELQSMQRTEPWMLFLTSRCDPKSVRRTVRSRLTEVFDENCKNDDFKNEASEQLGLTQDVAALVGGESVAEIDIDASFNLFGLGLTKWLAGISYRDWEVGPGNVVGYRVKDDTGCDMVSMVFYFSRVVEPIVDRVGLAPQRDPVNRKTESKIALDAIKKMSRCIDVDQLLHQDPVLRKATIEANAELLSEARYDSAEAMSWGSGNCWAPSGTGAPRGTGHLDVP